MSSRSPKSTAHTVSKPTALLVNLPPGTNYPRDPWEGMLLGLHIVLGSAP